MNHQNTGNRSSPLNWLEHLRNNSWEMELLLAGFVLVGLFQAPEALLRLRDALFLQANSFFSRNILALLHRMLDTSIRLITMNLIVLMIMRGYWIGLIGLDSAYQKKKEKNPEAPHQALQRSIKAENLTRRIVKMDDMCSIMFALTFLIVFVTIASGLFTVMVLLVAESSNLSFDSFLLYPYRLLVVLVFSLLLLTGVMNLIDFITIKWLSRIRKKWFSVPFRHISRIVSFLTLGFLTHRIYDTLTDMLPRRKFLAILLVYCAIVVILFFGFEIDNRIYMPFYYSYNAINPYEYLDKIDDFDLNIQTPSIQSDIITEPYIKLFIPYQVQNNKTMKEAGLQPLKNPLQTKHFTMDFINLADAPQDASQKVLDFYQDFYKLTIDDSIRIESKFLFYIHPHRNDPGLITYIPNDNLDNGLHKLTISKKGLKHARVIPFWLMKDERDADK